VQHQRGGLLPHLAYVPLLGGWIMARVSRAGCRDRMLNMPLAPSDTDKYLQINLLRRSSATWLGVLQPRETRCKTQRRPASIACGSTGVLMQCKSSPRERAELGWDAIKDVVTGAAYRGRYAAVMFAKVGVTNQYFRCPCTGRVQPSQTH